MTQLSGTYFAHGDGEEHQWGKHNRFYPVRVLWLSSVIDGSLCGHLDLIFTNHFREHHHHSDISSGTQTSYTNVFFPFSSLSHPRIVSSASVQTNFTESQHLWSGSRLFAHHSFSDTDFPPRTMFLFLKIHPLVIPWVYICCW